MSDIPNLTPLELERLALLVEECGEVQQVVGKIIRHGYGSHNPFDTDKIPNRRLLEKEISHLLFSIQLMVEYYDLNEPAIKAMKQEKEAKIQRYLHHNFVVKQTQPNEQPTYSQSR